MSIISFFLNIVIFFSVSSLSKWLFTRYTKNKVKFKWISTILVIITIIIWMSIPNHWLTLVFFAITFGTRISEKKINTKNKILY